MDDAKRSLVNLVIGIWIIMILITIPVTITAVIIKKYALSFFLGEILGSLTATGLACHMYHSLDVALDIGEHAVGYARRAALLRSFITLAVLAFSFIFPNIFNPVAVFLGLYGTKLSVYIQPIVVKIQKRKDITL